MMRKYIHSIVGCAAVALLMWLSVQDVEPRWADSSVVLGWSVLGLLAVAVVLHLPTGGKRLWWSWADVLVAAWMIYVVGRVWMGGEYACGTEFLKMMEMGLLYVALRGMLSWVRLSPVYLIGGLMLCGVYEATLGMWQMVCGVSRNSNYLLTGSFQNPGPYSAYLMMAAVAGWVWANEIAGSWPRTAVRCITAFIFFPLPATWSRAALVSVGLMAIWLCRNKYWKHRWGVWTGAAVVAVGFYLVKQGSADGRMLTWVASLTSWWHQPWLGVGVGGFSNACSDGIAELYQANPASRLFASGGVTEFAFNDLLKVLLEQGLVGALLCVAIAVLVMMKLYRTSLPLFYGLLSLFLFSMFSYPFELLPYQIIHVLLSAFSVSDAGQDGKQRRCRPWCVMLVFVLLPIAFFVAKEIQNRYEADKEVRMFSGMHHEAFINDYYELMPLEMDNAAFLFDFGKTLREAKRHNDSNAVLRQGALVSGDPMFGVLMGNNYKDVKCFGLSEKAYRKAFSIMPNRLYPLYQLMMMYAETGEERKASMMAQRILDFKEKIPSSATKEMKDKARSLKVKKLKD